MTQDFLDQAEDAIMKAIRAYRPTLMKAYGAVAYDTKGDKTVVTKLDSELEQILRNVLRGLDSSLGIEGEELGIEGNRQTYWLVDPIDGTEQFIRGIPTCKNLLTLIDNGKPVWAMMYLFARDELWLARSGKGTTKNNEPVVMQSRPLNRCWFDLSVDLSNPENMQKVLHLRSRIAGFTIMRDTTLVAEGKIDGSIGLGTGGGPWDYAPRALLFQEAGAKIANIGSQEYDFSNNNFLVTHPSHFETVMSLLEP